MNNIIYSIGMPVMYRAFLSNEKQFKQYAAAYLKKNHPEMEPIVGQKPSMTIQCRMKSDIKEGSA
ncbi:hypothetical protein [Fictibacillus sp. NRS-1165]|uniref:hypothetical protein n=1 Tax=Fictibacillus sp. NRS-1165 TaxID=3144463 RepID=UPI003D1B5EBC